jgi:hypothetical protein
MDLAAFKATLKLDTPPENLDSALEALWQDGKGNWDTAHTLAQDAPDPNGAWVHAYLHRVEGDESNAGHWYRRAEKPHCKSSLPEEWDAIATALLAG